MISCTTGSILQHGNKDGIRTEQFIHSLSGHVTKNRKKVIEKKKNQPSKAGDFQVRFCVVPLCNPYFAHWFYSLSLECVDTKWRIPHLFSLLADETLHRHSYKSCKEEYKRKKVTFLIMLLLWLDHLQLVHKFRRKVWKIYTFHGFHGG